MCTCIYVAVFKYYFLNIFSCIVVQSLKKLYINILRTNFAHHLKILLSGGFRGVASGAVASLPAISGNIKE